MYFRFGKFRLKIIIKFEYYINVGVTLLEWYWQYDGFLQAFEWFKFSKNTTNAILSTIFHISLKKIYNLNSKFIKKTKIFEIIYSKVKKV